MYPQENDLIFTSDLRVPSYWLSNVPIYDMEEHLFYLDNICFILINLTNEQL